jgi:hypothetical protein
MGKKRTHVYDDREIIIDGVCHKYLGATVVDQHVLDYFLERDIAFKHEGKYYQKCGGLLELLPNPLPIRR